MTGDEVGDERDPLLVRPFVLRDSGALESETSDGAEPTWPAADRDAGAGPGSGGADDATAVIVLPGAKPRSSGRRRLVVVAAAAVAVLLGVAAAGYAALRSDVRPQVTGLADGPLPPASGPAATAGSAAASSGASASTAVGPGSGSGVGTGSGTNPGSGRGPTSGATSTGPAGSTTTPSSGAGGAPAIATSPTSPVATATTAPGGKTATPSVPAGIAPVPPADERVGAIRGQNGVCLDLNGGVPFDGNHVQVFGCNRSFAQTWTIASDGTLRVAGKCALLVGDASVEIVGCDGRTTAQWRVSGQLIVNASNDDCLTDPSGGRWAGTGVRVEDCNGSAKQRWSLP
ncbi:ricin-type beta-trefoil lectin domain protein [Actinoplanes sp. CA-131856]